jgi:hypothetical protein
MKNRVIVLTILFVILAATGVYATIGSWTSTSNDGNTLLWLQTSTVLENGKVLIAGGVGLNGAIPAPSLFDPNTRTFATTGSLVTSRNGHNAVLLNNGLVLVVGGNNPNTGSLSSAELYTPQTGTFTGTGSLNVPRYGATATLLKNGMVLVIGGAYQNQATVLNSAELYDPKSGTFTLTGNLILARWHHTATLLDNGKVLVAGGQTNYPTCFRCTAQYTGAAELYDPATGTFTSTGSMIAPRLYHSATLLNSGNVLVAGGPTQASTAAEIYNPTTGTFTTTAPLIVWRDQHTATLLNNGTVLLAGGYQPNLAQITFTAEVYDPVAGTFSATPNMAQARYNNSASLLGNGSVLVVAGTSATLPAGAIGSAETYSPASLTPTALISISVAPANQTFAVGVSVNLTATGTFNGSGTETLASASWSSTNTAVATVSNDWSNYGTVLGVGPGTATIKACTGTICGSIDVTVLPHASLLLGGPSGAGGVYEKYDDNGSLLANGTIPIALTMHTAIRLQKWARFRGRGHK